MTTPFQGNAFQIGDYANNKVIEFVGANTGITAVVTDSITIDLTALTGGIGTAALENDIVVVVHFARTNNVDLDMGVSTSGYTEVADLYADATTRDPNLSVSWKRMGSTPDTSVSFNNVGAWPVAVAYVLRGVDTTTALDVTSTTATATGTGIPDPPSITPTTADSVVLAIGGAMSLASTAITAPSGYSNAVTVVSTSAPSDFTQIGVALKRWVSGSEDPGAFSGVSDDTNFGSAAVTLAFRAQQAAGGANTLTVNTAAVTLTGSSALVKGAFLVTANTRAVTLTGSSANLRTTRSIAVTSSAVTLTGSSVSLRASRSITVASSAVTLTGTSVNVRAGRAVAATTATVTLTGSSATVRASRRVSVTSAAVTLTGSSALVKASFTVAAATSTITLNGSSVTLTYTAGGTGVTLTVDSGSITLTGSSASIIAARLVSCVSSAITLTGASVNITYTAAGTQATPRPPSYGGGYHMWPEVSWLKKKKKPKKEELVAEVAAVVEQAVPQVTEDESRIVAQRLVSQISYAQLQRIQTLDAFIARVETELAEMDDEEVLLLAA